MPPQKPFYIRYAKIEDAENLLGVYVDALARTSQPVPVAMLNDPQQTKILLHSFEKDIRKSTQACPIQQKKLVQVAFEWGAPQTPIAYVTCRLNKTGIHVEQLYARKAANKPGPHLLERVRRLAYDAGINMMTLDVMPGAENFYRKLGFKEAAMHNNPSRWCMKTSNALKF